MAHLGHGPGAPSEFHPVGEGIKVNWAALARQLPSGRGAAEVRGRERIFKDLLARADFNKEGKPSKVGSHKFKGTVSVSVTQHGLRQTLVSHGAVQLGDQSEALPAIIGKAFRTARSAVAPVTKIEQQYIDMSGFHACCLYMAHALDLRARFLRCAPELAGEHPATWSLHEGQFRQLVQSLGDPSSSNLRSSCWAGSHELESWAADPRAAYAQLKAARPSLPFEVLADRCLLAVALAASADEPGDAYASSESARKRAFQLLQALNNTPSLPNAVPGPLPERRQEPGPEEIRARDALFDDVRQSRWTSSQQRFFPPQTPRPPAKAAPPVELYTLTRDRGAGVAPKVSLFGGGAGSLRLTGNMLLTPRGG